MSELDLRAVNVNLLVALDVLLDVRNVSRAATILGVTQSAASQSLTKLRELFDDPLLVRRGRTMVPTHKALRIAGPLHQALDALGRAVRAATHFDPARSTRRFVLGMPDLTSALVLPRLLADLEARAPNVRIAVEPIELEGVASALEEGRWDLAFPGFRESAPGLEQVTLHRDQFVCIVRKRHPLAKKGVVHLDDFTHARHVSFGRPTSSPSTIARTVGAFPESARLAAEVPYLLAHPLLVRHCDAIVTVPRRLAAAFANDRGIVVLEAPKEFPAIESVMVWHERFRDDPGHRFLRDRVLAAARADRESVRTRPSADAEPRQRGRAASRSRRTASAISRSSSTA